MHIRGLVLIGHPGIKSSKLSVFAWKKWVSTFSVFVV